MNIEELQDALDYNRKHRLTASEGDAKDDEMFDVILEAARLVANPNIDEAEATLEKLADLPIGIGFRQAAHLVVAAALTPGDTHADGVAHTTGYSPGFPEREPTLSLSVQWCETHGSVDVDGYCEAFHADASSGRWSRDRFDDVIAERFGKCEIVAAALTPGDT